MKGGRGGALSLSAAGGRGAGLTCLREERAVDDMHLIIVIHLVSVPPGVIWRVSMTTVVEVHGHFINKRWDSWKKLIQNKGFNFS